MTLTRLAIAGGRYYWRTHLAVAMGVAAAVAVLAGSLLVGASVRNSLAELASSRLGRTDTVVTAETPFSDSLGDRLTAALPSAIASMRHAPILVLPGIVRHQASGRRAADTLVYGVDARFFALHGAQAAVPAASQALLSPDLAAELGANAGDELLVRLARPTDIPVDSLHGKRDDPGQSLRLTSLGILPREAAGEFSLAPAQGPVRSVYVSMARLQRDLELAGRANVILLGGAARTDPKRLAAAVPAALSAAVTVADLGLKIDAGPTAGSIIVESVSGLIPEAVATAIGSIAARESLTASPVLTWMATRLTVRDRSVPYSIVTAADAGIADGQGLRALAESATIPGTSPPIVLTEWTARDLGASAGDALDLEYYRWTDAGTLATERATFRIAGVLPMEGPAIDRRLAPDYPGITSSETFADWDPPFPINLKLVRPIDEAYWKQYRTAPKAFVPLAVGQRLWKTKYGQMTSLRLRTASGAVAATAAGVDTEARLAGLRASIARGVDPARAGLTVTDVRSQNLAASAGATDFGAYFSYFSFFLMVSALLLTALFFRLSIEQRRSEIGVLRATGFSIRVVRRLFLIEGALVTLAGALAGTALAVGWAALMMYGLRTWWRDAVGTTLLRVHVDWPILIAGSAAAAVAALLSIVLTLRHLSRETPRRLLSGSVGEPAGRRSGISRLLAISTFVAALALTATSAAGAVPAAAGFFGAGALVLVAGLALGRTALDQRGRSQSRRPGLTGLALANAAWRPGRSLTAAGLVAAAVFLLVSVDSFRKRGGDGGRDSGTGGFALIAESAFPIVHDLASAEGQRELILDPNDPALQGVEIVSLRLRPGDDASCLNLYQPKRPRVVGVPAAIVDSGRFRFASSTATTEADKANPWRLLGEPDGAGVVPAVVDQTSLQYVLHAAVGDLLTIDADTTRPIQLRIVAALADSVLQGEILIADRAFQHVFPDEPGYRMFLVGLTPPSPERVAATARALEDGLEPFGFDAQETARRLETYHRVENTYLSTFQALGGLGLVLGVFGLVAIIARNILERRRELALLGAAGYSGGDLQRLVLGEHLALIGAGLTIGVASALVAIAPVLTSRGAGLPVHALLWLLPVTIAGVTVTVITTRSVRRLPLVESLRSE